MDRLTIATFLALLLFAYSSFTQNSNAQLPPKYGSWHYNVLEQKQLSWVLKNDITTRKIVISTEGQLKTRYNGLLVDIIDSLSVKYIPDSVIYLQKLQELKVEGNGLLNISSQLSKLKKMKKFGINTLGRKKSIRCSIPILYYVTNLTLLSSDSITVSKALNACPNVKEIELHIDFWGSNWNVYNIFNNSRKLHLIEIPYWEGLKTAEYDRHYYKSDSSKYSYTANYFVDLNLSNLKSLRKVITDYKLSEPMQMWCKEHNIKVVPFTRNHIIKKKKVL